jgi:hypothetical protein
VFAEHQQSVVDFLLARLIPVRESELAGTFLADLNRVLKLVNFVEVLRVVGIDQGADDDHHVTSAHILFGERVRRVVVGDEGDIMVVVDDLQRHKALAGIRERDRDWPGCKVEHAEGIKGVTLDANNCLMIDRGRLTAMTKLANACVLRIDRQIIVGLSAHEIIDGDRDRGA